MSRPRRAAAPSAHRYPRTARLSESLREVIAEVPGAAGVSWGEALAMITSRPAQVIGMGGKIGSLTGGAAGDVVIWSGDPLELASATEAVWIDGVRQPLESRQTKLRDRYQRLDRSALPEAYRR